MWVFGYGSLMWDEWERSFNGTKVNGAVLTGHRRAFNKKSVENWGTEQEPCPTLGLEQDENATCTGVAFQFDEEWTAEVQAYLREREGPSFDFVEVEINLPGTKRVRATVAINDPSAASYIGDKTVEQRARMIEESQGKDGTCFDYLKNTRSKLVALSIEDNAVEALWKTVMQNR